MQNTGAKVVQGERRRKEKPQVFHFLIPSRSLPYAKVVQGESRAKEDAKHFPFALPSRSLPYIIICVFRRLRPYFYPNLRHSALPLFPLFQGGVASHLFVKPEEQSTSRMGWAMTGRGKHPLLTGSGAVENRCYVKKFTNDVIFFTYYVTFFT